MSAEKGVPGVVWKIQYGNLVDGILASPAQSTAASTEITDTVGIEEITDAIHAAMHAMGVPDYLIVDDAAADAETAKAASAARTEAAKARVEKATAAAKTRGEKETEIEKARAEAEKAAKAEDKVIKTGGKPAASPPWVAQT